MDLDPTSREAPPARHILESDSEDSGDEIPSKTTDNSSSSAAYVPPTVTMQDGEHIGKPTKTDLLLILFGSIGEAYLRSFLGKGTQGSSFTVPEHTAIFVSEEQQGSVHYYVSDGQSYTIALLHPNSTLSSRPTDLGYLASRFIRAFVPSRVLLLDEYFPALYLSDEKKNNSGDELTLRYLHADAAALQPSKDIQLYKPPNFCTGASASFLAEMNSHKLPATLLLVPQVQSAVNPHLQNLQIVNQTTHSSHLATRPEALDTNVAKAISNLLPFPVTALPSSGHHISLTSFLDERRTAVRKNISKDISAMYM